MPANRRTRRAARKAAPRALKSANRRPAEAALAELKQRLLEINDLHGAAALLNWDQATYMPKAGAPARGRQGALLARLAHERLTDPALGRLLDRLSVYAGTLPPDSDDACLLRVARRDFEKAIKLPPD
jgi:carboxypeptidase Taq